jgi:hypothetical protein
VSFDKILKQSDRNTLKNIALEARRVFIKRTMHRQSYQSIQFSSSAMHYAAASGEIDTFKKLFDVAIIKSPR